MGCAAAFAAAACVAAEPRGERPGSSGSDPDAVYKDQCPQSQCGDGNSPVVAGVYFWRLSSYGEPNGRGVKITKVVKAGVPMRLIAVDDELRGVDLHTGAVIVSGSQINGTTVYVSVEGKDYAIDIEYHDSYDEHFWVVPVLNQKVRVYKLTYSDAAMHDRGEPQQIPLCQRTDAGPANEPVLHAMVFTGDTYDPFTRKVYVTDTEGWMNIACEASAPWKMHLMAHTTAAANRFPGLPAVHTSLAQRQALLNAWTMNACGDGVAFTRQGVPISLTPQPNWLPMTSGYQPDAPTREAIWGPSGALCLDTHRLSINEEDAKTRKEAIESVCGRPLPSCDTVDTSTGGPHVTTGVPDWPPLILIAK
jgi:hypothetical protein